jgi:hypothetical protein
MLSVYGEVHMKDEYVALSVREVGERERNEYNAFGPWIQEIKGAEDMPPRFDSYWDQCREAARVIKVPYHVERREALPGSNLYEHVMAFGNDGIMLISIEGDSTVRRDLAYSRLSSVSLSIELLDGRLAFREAGGPGVKLHFNAVSEPLAREFVDLVRSRCQALSPVRSGEGRMPGPDLVAPPGKNDVFFSNLFREFHSRDSASSLLAYQCPSTIQSLAGKNRSLGQRLLALFRGAYLSSSMILQTRAELILVRASREVGRKKSGSYWYETLWLPQSSLRGAKLETRSLGNGGVISVLFIESSDGEYEFNFSEPPALAYARLKELAGPARA